MPRSQTNPLQTANLKPSARPVDVFTTPGNRPSGAGSELAQLSQALSSIRPELGQMLDHRFQAEVAGSTAKAIRDAGELRLRNRDALKAAVDGGKIAEWDNPYYKVSLRQEVAKAELSDAKNNIWNEYLQSDVRFAELAEADKFFSERLGSLMEGRDAWEAEVIQPGIEHAKAGFMATHIAQKDEQRQEEMEIATKRSISEIMGSVSSSESQAASDGDPVAQAKIAGVQDQLRQLMAEKSKVVRGVKLEQWMVDTALNTTANGRPGLGSQLLSGLGSFDQKSDLGRAYAGQLERADEAAQDRLYRKQRQADEIEQKQIEKARKSVSTQLLQGWDEYKTANPDAKGSDILKIELPLSKLDPDARIQIEHLRDIAANRQDRKLNDSQTQALQGWAAEFAEGSFLGTSTDRDKVNLFKTSILFGKPEMWSSLMAGVHSFKRDKDIETDPAAVRELNDLWANGKLDLFSLTLRAPKLSSADQSRWTSLMLQATKEGHEDVGPEYRVLESKLVTAFSGLNMIEEGTDEDTRKRLEIQTQVDLAEARTNMLQELHSIEQHKDWTPAERAQARQLALNTQIGKYLKVPTYDAYLKTMEEHRKGKEAAKAEVVKPPPAPMNEEVFKVKDNPDPEFSGITGEQTNAALLGLKMKADASTNPKHLSEPIPKDQTRDWFNMFPTAGKWATNNAIYHEAAIRSPKAASGFPRDNYPQFDANGNVDPSKPPLDVPDIQEHNSRLEMRDRDNAFRYLPSVKERAATALTRWKTTADLLVQRQKAGTPFITYEEKRTLAEDTGVGRQLARFRQVYGYQPEEVKKLGPDSWKNYRMYMNYVDLEENGPKAAALLGIKTPEQMQAFLTAQKMLIEKDVHTFERLSGY